MIATFLTSLGYPKVLEKNGPKGPKKEDFQKMKKIVPRYSSYRCVKFQHDSINFEFVTRCSKVLGNIQRFEKRTDPKGSKRKNFKKLKK